MTRLQAVVVAVVGALISCKRSESDRDGGAPSSVDVRPVATLIEAGPRTVRGVGYVSGCIREAERDHAFVYDDHGMNRFCGFGLEFSSAKPLLVLEEERAAPGWEALNWKVDIGGNRVLFRLDSDWSDFRAEGFEAADIAEVEFKYVKGRVAKKMRGARMRVRTDLLSREQAVHRRVHVSYDCRPSECLEYDRLLSTIRIPFAERETDSGR
ncbi:MAG: hypothetical protein J0I07_14910 [Myxococcales bacterium]|nr:hypothetical protein [Myxococcales bacterium]